MEPGGSLPHSQMPATCSYPEPAQSSPCPHILKIHLNIILPPTPGFPGGFFLSGFLTKTLYAPVLSPTRAKCQAHSIPLDLITRKILGQQYRSLSSSLCSLLHFPVILWQISIHCVLFYHLCLGLPSILFLSCCASK